MRDLPFAMVFEHVYEASRFQVNLACFFFSGFHSQIEISIATGAGFKGPGVSGAWASSAS